MSSLRQNEYFMAKNEVSSEVIQADICRYLGNDARIKAGQHSGKDGFFIYASQTLTPEIISNIQADSARWEAHLARRANLGYSRVSYNVGHNYLPIPMHPTSHVPPDTPGSPQDDFAKPLDSEHETIDPPQSANEYGLEYKIRAIDRLWHKYKARGKLGDLPKDYATSPATPTTLSKQRPAMINEISCAVINCLQSLNKLLSGMQFSEHQLDVPLVLWHDELGRLRVWAANIGAHKTGQSSLDHRLRDASDIKRQILQLLKRLQRVIEHLKGTLDVPSAPIEEDLSAPGDEEHESEIYSIYNALRETINDLFQLSVIIRRPAQRDRFLGTKRADAVMFEPFDRQHVNDKYPRADPRILDRLGLAISKRRAVLRYRERHHIKLGQGLNAILDDDTQSAMLSETIATEFANLSETAGNDIWETRSSISQTSYAQTILHGGDGMTLPPPPKESVDGDPFECPYCFEIITIEKETAWAHHVFSDLMPYICIFLDCSTPHRLYDSRREWYFHLQSQHSIADDSSVCPDCPLCLSSISSGRQFERHVGRHLQELALFALPRFGPEEDDLRAFTESQEALEESEYEDESDIPDISQVMNKMTSAINSITSDQVTSDQLRTSLQQLQVLNNYFRTRKQ